MPSLLLPWECGYITTVRRTTMGVEHVLVLVILVILVLVLLRFLL